MPKLYLKFKDGTSKTLENVVDAGIANDFFVIRFTDGVVTFTETEPISDAQFDPTEDEPAEADGESTDDTPSQ